MKPSTRACFAVCTALPLLVSVGCDNHGHQNSLRDYSVTRQFPNESTARSYPPHTVARGQPAAESAYVTGLKGGEPVTDLPMAPTRALLARGQERFEINCAPCHGSDGYGQGIVVRRGFPPPPSYHEERLRQAPIGHFVDVMRRGFGVMYPFADRLPPDDRWAIAAYIRALQLSQHATLTDVPPAERGRLASTP